MATIEQRDAVSRERVAGYVLLGLLGVGVIAVLVAFFNRPPQMGTDEDVFRTVDALYTAVRAKDEKRLGECETRLRGYREAGKLPEDAAATLDGVIAKARGGRWESAAESLYEFMSAQRREGMIPHEHREPKRAAKPSGVKS